MIYLTKAIKSINKLEETCTSKEDIVMRICNIIMPYWDAIMQEVEHDVNRLESILNKLFNSTTNYYTQPILNKFTLHYNSNTGSGCTGTII